MKNYLSVHILTSRQELLFLVSFRVIIVVFVQYICGLKNSNEKKKFQWRQAENPSKREHVKHIYPLTYLTAVLFLQTKLEITAVVKRGNSFPIPWTFLNHNQGYGWVSVKSRWRVLCHFLDAEKCLYRTDKGISLFHFSWQRQCCL